MLSWSSVNISEYKFVLGFFWECTHIQKKNRTSANKYSIKALKIITIFTSFLFVHKNTIHFGWCFWHSMPSTENKNLTKNENIRPENAFEHFSILSAFGFFSGIIDPITVNFPFIFVFNFQHLHFLCSTHFHLQNKNRRKSNYFPKNCQLKLHWIDLNKSKFNLFISILVVCMQKSNAFLLTSAIWVYFLLFLFSIF